MDKVFITKTMAFSLGVISSGTFNQGTIKPERIIMTVKRENKKNVIRIFCSGIDESTNARQAKINPAEVAIPPNFKMK